MYEKFRHFLNGIFRAYRNCKSTFSPLKKQQQKAKKNEAKLGFITSM